MLSSASPTCFKLYYTHGIGDVSPHGHKMAAAVQSIMCYVNTVQK